ncbi:MAG TPA: hypothetical protein VHX20_07155 [Terracidiphilus sp.]|jgi:hypothetical protein|nr:hypothetical protein [Terracidiphilus sp.]
MSLLHQETPDQLDDAARGEELTKGTSHVVIAAIIATVVVSIVIAIYVIAGQKPPVVTGEVVAVWAHPMHAESKGFDANGAPMPQEEFDQVYVFTEVRLKNQSQMPLFLLNAMTNATLPDSIHSSYAASAGDYDRVFLAYPQMPVPHNKPLALDTTIQPGQTVEGTIVSAFKLTRAQWDSRKDLNFSFSFRYQPRLVLTPNVPITEQ